MGQKKRQKMSGNTLGYHELMQNLQINEVRQLEDYIIEAIYSSLVQGKLDQKNK